MWCRQPTLDEAYIVRPAYRRRSCRAHLNACGYLCLLLRTSSRNVYRLDRDWISYSYRAWREQALGPAEHQTPERLNAHDTLLTERIGLISFNIACLGYRFRHVNRHVAIIWIVSGSESIHLVVVETICILIDDYLTSFTCQNTYINLPACIVWSACVLFGQ